MCAIENLGRICRYTPRGTDLGRAEVLTYDGASIRLESLRPRQPPYFDHNTACAVVRGLAEYMTKEGWWVESLVQVAVEGTVVGSALVWDPEGRGAVVGV